MRENPVIDRERLEALAAFAPLLRQSKVKGSWSQTSGEGTAASPCVLPHWQPSTLENDFIQQAYDAELVIHSFDWASWLETEEAKPLMLDRRAITRADATQLFRLITAVVRADRFCDGAFGDGMANGLILALAERAEVLVGQR